MDTTYFDPDTIRDAFRFLVTEFHYSITRDGELFHENRPYEFIIEYAYKDRRVRLTHDYKESFFNFVVIRGPKTRYPNDYDQANIVTFWRLFKSYEPSLDLEALQPVGRTCAEAALINAQLLRKYGSKILRGEEWISL